MIEIDKTSYISNYYPTSSEITLKQYYNNHFIYRAPKEIVTSTTYTTMVKDHHPRAAASAPPAALPAPAAAAAGGDRNSVNRYRGGWTDAFPNIGKGGKGDGTPRFEKPLVGAIMATVTALCAIAGGLLT
jgi:hypothetical protein